MQKSLPVRGILWRRFSRKFKDGDYDLVCMGSPYSASALRQFYTPNVTAEIAESYLLPRHDAALSSPNQDKPGVYFFSHSAIAARMAALISSLGTSSIPSYLLTPT